MAEGSVITEKGRALLGKILATNSTLNITGAQIGSGECVETVETRQVG